MLALIMSVCVITGIIIRYRTRFLVDIYHIREEIGYEILFVFLALIVMFTAVLLNYIHNNDESNNLSQILHTINIACSYLLLVGITLLTTFFPIAQHFKQKQKHKTQRKTSGSFNKIGLPKLASVSVGGSSGGGGGGKSNSMPMSKYKKAPTLEQFIEKEEGFKLFMSHLATEFSTGL